MGHPPRRYPLAVIHSAIHKPPPQPFFDASSPIHDYFPAREWAVRLPAFLLVVGLSGIGLFIGSTIMKEKAKKAQKARLRAA